MLGGGGEERRCLSRAFCSSAHSIAMVISSKTEEQSLPITPAAPAPCTDRMNSPFPRKQERAGGDRGSLHRTSPGSHPPALQGQLLRPRPLPRMAITAPSPGTAWAGARDAGCGMQRRPGRAARLL